MMKTPQFWEKSGHPASRLLAPAGWVWRQVSTWRRTHTQARRTPIPSICIGNITAGGAGKTPTALCVAKLLQEHGAKPAFGSRGYGAGLSAACIKVDPAKHMAAEVGDEALLLAAAAPCYVSRDRMTAARAAAADGASHIIFDDGLQNPSIAYDRAVLVLDGNYGVGNGHIIPAGPLRESLTQAAERCRAVLIIGEDRHGLAAQLPDIKILHGDLLADTAHLDKSKPYLAFAGIGRPEKFFSTCRACGLRLAATLAFPDHHPYSAADLVGLAQKAMEQRASLLTTAKDAARLSPAWRAQAAVLPVTLEPTEPETLLAALIP